MIQSTAPTRSAARATSFASTATTVVALLAIASAARIVPVGEVLVLHESRPAVRESTVVRAVAVAVAAARDLLNYDQNTTSTFDLVPSASVTLQSVCEAPSPIDESPHLPTARLAERLLDLPPPIV